MTNVFDAHRSTVGTADYYLANVVRGAQKADTPNVVKLLAYGIEAAAGVGVIRSERGDDLRYRDMKVKKTGGVEQHLILHGGAAEAGVVGYTGDAAVGTLDDPVFEGF